MKAILLAAGLGTRLRPLTDSIPKCLVPINGKPLLLYWFELLTVNGVGPLLVNLHYQPEQVLQCIRSSQFCANVETVFEPLLLGTGGTVAANADFFGQEPFLVIHADNLSFFDVAAFMQRHCERPTGCEITMLTFVADDPSSCGIVDLRDDGVVQRFVEKSKNPPGNLANGAVYIFEPSVLTFLQGLNKAFIDISTEVLPHFIGRIHTFHNDVYHRDIGTLASYRQAESDSSSHTWMLSHTRNL